MKLLHAAPALAFCGLLALDRAEADAQVTVTRRGESVVVSPPPPVVVQESVVIKERRRLFRPRDRVYVVRPRSRRISVPATTTVVEPAAGTPTILDPVDPIDPIDPPAVIDPPAPIVRPGPPARPGLTDPVAPARLDEPTLDVPQLEKAEPEVKVQSMRPASSAPRPATIIRSTPR